MMTAQLFNLLGPDDLDTVFFLCRYAMTAQGNSSGVSVYVRVVRCLLWDLSFT